MKEENICVQVTYTIIQHDAESLCVCVTVNIVHCTTAVMQDAKCRL